MLQGLQRLSLRLHADGQLDDAITATRRILALEPWREDAHRQLMALLAQNGQRGAALAHFELCREQLERELDVEPSATTLALVAEIRAGTAPQLQTTEPHALYPRRTSRSPKLNYVTTRVEFPLMGREREWQLVQNLWHNLHQPHFLCIGGEAGIGKTRLVEELLLLAELAGASVARTRSHALQGQLAYGPITDWLRAAPLQSGLAQLDALWLTELIRLLPELLIEHPQLSAPAPLRESWQRKRLFDALCHGFATPDEPLLLVLDDVQWTDVDTLEWLQYLVESREMKLLVVTTVRSDEIEAEHPLHRLRQQLQRHDKFTELPLAPLTTPATAALAMQVAQQQLSDDAIEHLFQETTGNPLFVIETMRATQEKPVAKPLPLRLGKNASQEQHFVPTKIYSVLQGRLAQLSPTAQMVAQLGATVGRRFDVTLLVKAAGLDEDRVFAALDELWRRRVIAEVDALHFDFSHDRIRDVAYAEISPIQRRRLHQRVVNALEAIHAENLDLVAGQMATHCRQAGLIEKAVGYANQAAQYALQLSANEEAIAYLENGLTMLDRFPPHSNIARQKLALLITLAVPVAAIKGAASHEVELIYTDAQALCQKLGEPPTIPILRGLASIYITRARLNDAHHHLQNMLQRVEHLQEPAHVVEANYAMGTALFWMGRHNGACEHLQKAIFTSQQISSQHHTAQYLQSPRIICHSALSLSLWCSGFPEQALEHGKTSLELAQSEGHALSYAYVLSHFSRLQYCLFTPHHTLKYAEKSIQLATEREFKYWVVISQMFQGWAMAELGMPHKGLAVISDALQAYEKTGGRVSSPWFLGLAAKILLKLNEVEAGLKQVEQALDISQTTKDCVYMAELWRLKGEFLLMQRTQEQTAEAAFQQAIDIAQSQHAKSWELRATISLSRLWQKQGKVAEAHHLLSDIYGWFTEGFGTADLMEANTLLNELAILLPLADGMKNDIALVSINTQCQPGRGCPAPQTDA
ncbi:MAG: AAA family ATPase [Caldilineaceae bacterium]|nr:AAA family ATPase [Caldilineaceae bacterium]